MAELNDQDLQGLRRLLDMNSDGAMTKSEALKLFKQMVEFLAKNKQENETFKQALQQAIKQITDKLDIKHSSLNEGLRKQVDSLFVGEKMSAMEKKHAEMMGMADMKVKGLRHGKDGMPGKPGLRGPAGSPDLPKEVRNKLESLEGQERLDKSAIKGLDELEKKVESAGRGRIISGPMNLTQYYNASSQADGSNRTFTGIPTARHIPMIFLKGQNPVTLLADVDYTIGNKSITILNHNEPPAANVGVYIQYIK